MSSSFILQRFDLGLHWPTQDPFLFCAYHQDKYPPANADLGPESGLEGRALGQDFEGRDGWRMYHGEKVPGFPAHPHRGFETVTMVRRGSVDHADSLGAAGRYGAGDVQWMTAGRGVQHSEMFPLLARDHDNPQELFQLWLNLPAASKLSDPHFAMFWREQVPVYHNDSGLRVEVIAGGFADTRALTPPPASWAAQEDADVQIWLLSLAAGAQIEIPAAAAARHRMLYFYAGSSLEINDSPESGGQGFFLRADQPLRLVNTNSETAQLLFLQGRPINEPVAQYGPFVMNTREELQQAFADYQQTSFGGWPWPRQDQVHGSRGRFARFADGRESEPESAQ